MERDWRRFIAYCVIDGFIAAPVVIACVDYWQTREISHLAIGLLSLIPLAYRKRARQLPFWIGEN